MQSLHTTDRQQVAANPGNVCSHLVEHTTQLLDVGFAGRIVDRRLALGQDGCHDDIGGARDGCFIQQHVASAQLLGLDIKDMVVVGTTDKLRTKILEAQEVGVETTAADLVATRLGNSGLTEATQQRTDHQHATTQGGALLDKLGTLQISKVEIVGLKHQRARLRTLHLDANVRQQADEIIDIENIGNIADSDWLGRQQRGADDLQRLIFSSLRGDGATQRVASFDNKRLHRGLSSFLFVIGMERL